MEPSPPSTRPNDAQGKRSSTFVREEIAIGTDQTMKIPGPDHPIEIARSPQRVRVTFAGRVVADTQRALTLSEAGYPAVQYIPRADADMSLLRATTRHTHCPYKGDASYFSIEVAGRTADNAVWTYEQPYPAVAQIAGYLAFYVGCVDAIETLPA
jgi:uncharacterized protein (DUF427 family)